MKKLLSMIVMLCFFISTFSSADVQVNQGNRKRYVSGPQIDVCVKEWEVRERAGVIVENRRETSEYFANMSSAICGECGECNCRDIFLVHNNPLFSKVLDDYVVSIRRTNKACNGIPESEMGAVTYRNQTIETFCSNLDVYSPNEAKPIVLYNPAAACFMKIYYLGKNIVKEKMKLDLIEKGFDRACMKCSTALNAIRNYNGNCSCCINYLDTACSECNKTKQDVIAGKEMISRLLIEIKESCKSFAQYEINGSLTNSFLKSNDPSICRVNNLENTVFVLGIIDVVLTLCLVVASIFHFCL